MEQWLTHLAGWLSGWNAIGLAIVFVEWLIRLGLTVQILKRRRPGPDALAWIALIALLPVLGLLVYLLLGEQRLGTRRVKRHEQIAAAVAASAIEANRAMLQDWQRRAGSEQMLASAVTRLTGLDPVVGNRVDLIDDAAAMLDHLIGDIDDAQHHVHMHYYIWGNSPRAGVVCDALCRAAQRGVTCRVVVDAVGSRAWLKSETPARLREAGVQVVAGLPVNFFRRRLHRIDLRNHRKITVIDARVSYCGSQNLIDERVRVRRLPRRERYWLDATCRIEGPATVALQAVFLADWLTSSDEQVADVGRYLTVPPVAEENGSIVHVVPSGPSSHVDAIHQSIVTMLSLARERVTMITPYFVPDEAVMAAIVSAALRGVVVTLIVPEQLDNYTVAAAARSRYAELLDAGVRIVHHRPGCQSQPGSAEAAAGLLHSKCAVVDGKIAMIGSANLDMRSFWINFECTLMVYDARFCDELVRLCEKYESEGYVVTRAAWAERKWWQHLRDNAAQLLAPLL